MKWDQMVKKFKKMPSKDKATVVAALVGFIVTAVLFISSFI